MALEQSHRQIGQSVGAKLRAARLAQKLTQSQLANPDFSVSYISAIERGQIHPSLRALEILANRLGLSSTQLLPRQGSPDESGSVPAPIPIREEEIIEWTLLEAQLFIWQDTPELALEQLEKLSTKNLKKRQLIQKHFLLGWAYLKMGQLQESEHLFIEAAQLAKDHGDHFQSARIFAQLGNTQNALSNYIQANKSYQQSLDYFESMEPKILPFLSQVYTYLGHNYSSLRDYPLAIQMFQKALLIIEKTYVPGTLETMYTTISQSFIALREFHLATLFAYKALLLFNRESLSTVRGELYHYLSRAMLKIDEEKAYDFMQQALQEHTIQKDEPSRAILTTHIAAWLLTHRTVGEAREQAQKAQQMILPFGDSIIAVETLLTLGRIEYAASNDTEGNMFFEAGLQMLERMRQYEELAEREVNFASILEEKGKVQEAIKYVRRAYEHRLRVGNNSHVYD